MKYPRNKKEHAKSQSHPARGAWIEINIQICRLQCGFVAPRTGCVD